MQNEKIITKSDAERGVEEKFFQRQIAEASTRLNLDEIRGDKKKTSEPYSTYGEEVFFVDDEEVRQI